MNKLVFAAALVLSLVGSSGQASADCGFVDTDGVSWEDDCIGAPDIGVTWE